MTLENVDCLVSEIPEPFRTAFIEWTRQCYAENVNPDDLVCIGGESTPSVPDCAIPAIKDWLQRNPV
jgi:hypothetical protein